MLPHVCLGVIDVILSVVDGIAEVAERPTATGQVDGLLGGPQEILSHIERVFGSPGAH